MLQYYRKYSRKTEIGTAVMRLSGRQLFLKSRQNPSNVYNEAYI